MGKILLIIFCVLCFVGMIAAEIFVSSGQKKPTDQKNDPDHRNQNQ